MQNAITPRWRPGSYLHTQRQALTCVYLAKVKSITSDMATMPSISSTALRTISSFDFAKSSSFLPLRVASLVTKTARILSVWPLTADDFSSPRADGDCAQLPFDSMAAGDFWRYQPAPGGLTGNTNT